MNTGGVRREAVVFGLGHIGASLAAALTERGWTIWGWDSSPTALKHCRKQGWLRGVAGPAMEVTTNNLICVLALPETAVTDDRFRTMLAKLPPAAIVTDVFSSKGDAALAVKRACAELDLRYGWSHPLAGREGSGATSADGAIFEGARVLIESGAPTAVRAELARFWKAAGCQVEYASTEEHQRRMAAGSHLMHLLAFSLMHAIGDEGAASPSVLGVTRVAKSNPDAWASILMSNRADLAVSVDTLMKQLKKASRLLRKGSARALRQYLLEGQRLRLKLENQ